MIKVIGPKNNKSFEERWQQILVCFQYLTEKTMALSIIKRKMD